VKLSEGVEWALHCCVLLAALPPGVGLPAKALAEFHGVSESYLIKQLKALVKAKVLASAPGPKGGFRLARPAEQITLLDVVRGVEGPQPAFRCTEIRGRGPARLGPGAYRLPCMVTVSMLEAEQAWANILRSKTLATLVRELSQKLDPRAVEKTMAWLREIVQV